MKSLSTFRFLIVMFVLAVAGCSKEPVKTNNTSGNLNISSPYYITGLLGDERIVVSGTSNPYVDTLLVDSAGHACGHGQNQDPDDHHTHYTQYVTGANWTLTTSGSAAVVQASMQLKKLSVRVYVAPIANPTSTTLYQLLQPADNLTFAYNPDPSNGVILSIRDSKGVLWTTEGDQTGSTFQIQSVGNNQGSYAIITGSINAKMYDGNGNVKQLTSAAYSAMMGL